MAEHRTVELLRQAYDAFDRGDVETVLSMLHEDVVWHIKGLGALDGDYQGPQAVMGFLGQSAAETEGTPRRPHARRPGGGLVDGSRRSCRDA